MWELLKDVGTPLFSGIATLLGSGVMYMICKFCYYGILSFMPGHPDFASNLALGIVQVGVVIAVLVFCYREGQ